MSDIKRDNSKRIKKENLRLRDHSKEELSFYSKATTDIEYKYPMGWGELWGIADRTDYDLSVHQEHSKQDLRYLDPVTNEKYLPYVIEPSVGLDRLVLALISDAYKEEVLEKLEKFKSIGIDGVECYYPANSEMMTETCVEFCKNNDMIITVGSDSHGEFGAVSKGIEYYIGAVKKDSSELNLKDMI